MPKTREQKQEQVQELTQALRDSKGVVFAQLGNITVEDATKLRFKAYKEGVKYVVAKKTLLDIALKEIGVDVKTKELEGSFGVAISPDEVASAKVINEFGKGRVGFKILGGLLEKKFVTGKEVTALAQLPSKQALLGSLVGTLQAPISGFVRVLNGNVSGFVRVLAAIKDKKAV